MNSQLHVDLSFSWMQTCFEIGHFSHICYKNSSVTNGTRYMGKADQDRQRAFIAVKHNIFPFKSILENVFSYSFWCILCLRLAAVKRELKVKEMHLQEAARRRLLQLQQEQREMELRRLDDEIERKVYYSFLCSHTLSLFTLIWM